MLTCEGVGRKPQVCSCCPTFSRRTFLAHVGAAAISGPIGATMLQAQSTVARPSSKPHRIDIHHHIVPPYWIKEKRDAIIGDHAGISNSWFLKWSPT